MPSGSLKKVSSSNNDLIFLILSFAAGAFVASLFLNKKDKLRNKLKNKNSCKLVEGLSCKGNNYK